MLRMLHEDATRGKPQVAIPKPTKRIIERMHELGYSPAHISRATDIYQHLIERYLGLPITVTRRQLDNKQRKEMDTTIIACFNRGFDIDTIYNNFCDIYPNKNELVDLIQSRYERLN